MKLFNVLGICTNSQVLKIIMFVNELLDILFFIVPMGLIIMLSLDLFKNVIAGREDDMKKNLNIVIKRLIMAAALFLVPTITDLALDIVSDAGINTGISYASCSKLATKQYIQFYEQQEKIKQKKEEEEYLKELAAQDTDSKFKNSVHTLSEANNGSGGTTNGQTYNLSDSQLKGLAALCAQEQGSVVGAAAEASLMANRFELYGSEFGTGADGLYNYVVNSGWWAYASTHVQDTSGVTNEILDAVKDVLVRGNRTLPLYIDEHDCYDCCSKGVCIYRGTNNGVEFDVFDRSKYQKDVSTLYNTDSAKYTFYSFPEEGSDPFGYTSTARLLIKGE